MKEVSMQRGAPPSVGTERELVEGWLNFQRATLAKKCEDSDAPELGRQPVSLSGLSLARLVRHLRTWRTWTPRF